MDKAVKGFTLIELVVVITILGILAAFAFPRFAALETEARIAVVEGLEGSIRSAATLAHSMELVGAAVTMEGNAITMVNGYPSGIAAGIPATLVDYTGFTPAYTVGPPAIAVFEKDGATTPANCSVSYTEPAAANNPPVISSTTGGC
jgi:MSHA pilin protein MshA